jgi:RHS repeat-associated protein
MNHTPAKPGVIETPEKAAYLYWVEGMAGMEAADKGVGPAIALRVSAGDKINIDTWARYERKETYARDFVLTALASALGNTFATLGGFEGLISSQVADNIGAALLEANYGSDGSESTVPFAYLNYIVYDDNLGYKVSKSKRVGNDAGFYPNEMGVPDDHQHLTFDEPIIINQDGYIYVWVSNQSEDTRVWFDDLTVTHEGTIVTQATDYGVWGDVLREQKTDESVYRFGYQGQFSERDLETGWNHFEAREYDPLVGRWLSVDPKRSDPSPYRAMRNNPIVYGDPDGKDVIILNDRNGASGFGHGAILVSKGDVWYLYSKNGTEMHGNYGESYNPDDGVMVGSLDDFFNGEFNKDSKGNTLYDRALLIHTDAETDAAIMEAASREVRSYYKLIGASCQDVWNCALDKAGLDFYQGYWPNDDFWLMQNFMTIGNNVERLPVPSFEVGPLSPGVVVSDPDTPE